MNHPQIDLAVFDMAGTTIDEGAIVYDALRTAAEEFGAKPSRDELDSVKGQDKIQAITTLLGSAGADTSPATIDACFARFTEALKDGYTHNPPQPMAGVEGVFEQLKQRGIRIALTTGFTREVAELVLKAAGWDSTTVDAVVTTDDVPAGRPAPYMIHEAMRRTGAQDVRRVISAGDTIVDIQSAKNAGAISVGVLSGDTSEESLRAENPSYLLDSVADLFTVSELA